MLSHSRKPKAQLDCTLSKLEKLSRARPVSTSLPPSTLVSPRRSESLVLLTLSTPVSLVSSVSKVNSRSYRAGQVGSRRSRRILFLILAPPKKFRTRKKSSATYFFPTRTQHLTDPGKCHSPLKSSSFLDFFHVAVCQDNP